MRYISKNKSKAMSLALVAIASTSILAGCDKLPTMKTNKDVIAETTTQTTQEPTSTYGKINGKEIKFSDLEDASLQVADLLGEIYYENYITIKLAEEKGISTKGLDVSTIESKLIELYNKEVNQDEAKKYVEENQGLYYNYNLRVAKFMTAEEAAKYNYKDIEELAKTVSCSELLKQTEGLTGMTDLRRYTNSLTSFDVGYITPEAIPFEDGYAYVEIVNKELRETAVDDAKNDLRTKRITEDYLADREAIEAKNPYVR